MRFFLSRLGVPLQRWRSGAADRRRRQEKINRRVLRELKKQSVLQLLIIVAAVIAAIGNEITRRSVGDPQSFFDPIHGFFITVGLAVVFGGGSVQLIYKSCRDKHIPSRIQWSVAVGLNVVTMLVAVVLWSVFFAAQLPVLLSPVR